MVRTLKFFPLTFAAGPWGFVVFLPYLLIIMGALGYLRKIRAVKVLPQTA